MGYQKRIVAVWVLIAALLVPVATDLENRLNAAVRVDQSEHLLVSEILNNQFNSVLGEPVVLVISGFAPGGPHTLVDMIDHIASTLEPIDGVNGTLSYRDTRDPLFLGDGKTGAIIVAGLTGRGNLLDDVVHRLREASRRLQAELRVTYPDLSLKWTGAAALSTDLRTFSARDAQESELRALPALIILLLIVFGSLVAAGLPLLVGLLSIPVALGLASFIAAWFSLSIILINVVTMLGLGLSIDYALLMVSRYREEIAKGSNRTEAARVASRTAGGTIILSGASVAIGLAGLVIVPINEIQSIAVGGLIIVGVSVLMATTLLPIVLMRLGDRLNAVSIHVFPCGVSRWRPWQKWAELIFDNPVRFIILGLVPLVLLAMQSISLDIGLPRGDWLPGSASSVQAIKELESLGRSGFFQTIDIVVDLPDDQYLAQKEGWSQIERMEARMRRDSRVASIRSITAVSKSVPRPWEVFDRLPDRVRKNFVSSDNSRILIGVVPKSDMDPRERSQLVRDIRDEFGDGDGRNGVTIHVGGLPALNVDYQDAVGKRFIPVVAAVVTITLIFLMFGFRCALLPIKAVLLNLLSVAAAFGALVLVFQDGFGSGLLGLAGPTGGVFPIIPILVFCVVFGLSMDYEVFLFHRVREAHLNGKSDCQAMAEGLEKTAGIITSAAVLMVVVFGAFSLGEFLLIKMLGLTLGVAIILDVTLVRLVLGPALFALAGRWNWWPKLARTIADYDRAIELSPDLARAYHNRGSVYASKGEYDRAVPDIYKAAEQGLAKAQNNLGNMYYYGRGVPQDFSDAVKWWRLAAEQGYALAQDNLGSMYATGRGVLQDYAEALKWYRLAAEQGFARAQSNLGTMYVNGQGVLQDYVEALKWYRKAAEQGRPVAQHNLGLMFANGLGVLKDYAEAVNWFRKAAEQGFAQAQSNLGFMYRDGQGVPQDLAEAVKWYRKAAEQGYAEAQYSLGVMYDEGRGVPQEALSH